MRGRERHVRRVRACGAEDQKKRVWTARGKIVRCCASTDLAMYAAVALSSAHVRACAHDWTATRHRLVLQIVAFGFFSLPMPFRFFRVVQPESGAPPREPFGDSFKAGFFPLFGR